MKRTIITVLLIIVSASMFAEYSDVPIPLLFSTHSGVNVGFSTTRPSIAWKEGSDIGTETNPITFSFSRNSVSGTIKSTQFLFYAQIYTTNAVEISVDSRTSRGSFRNDDGTSTYAPYLSYQNDRIPYTSSPALFDSLGNPQVLMTFDAEKVPRVGTINFNLSIDPDDLVGKSADAVYEGNIVLKVEII